MTTRAGMRAPRDPPPLPPSLKYPLFYCGLVMLLGDCSVYKEKALGDVDIDPVYLNGWVAVYQFLFSIPLLIPSAIASNVCVLCVPRGFPCVRHVTCSCVGGASCVGALCVSASACVVGGGAHFVPVAVRRCVRRSFVRLTLSFPPCHPPLTARSIPDLPANLWNGMRCLAQADSVLVKNPDPNGLQVRNVAHPHCPALRASRLGAATAAVRVSSPPSSLPRVVV